MSKEMIISVNGREKKIAIIEDGQPTEFYIERGEENSGVVGNIYKGRVQRVLPGMQSAFVDIGLERDAFLYVSDFFDEEEEIERIVMEKKKNRKSDDEAEREATDEIHKNRLKRDKKIDNQQEKAETVADDNKSDDEEGSDNKKGGRQKKKRPNQRKRSKGKKQQDSKEESQDEKPKEDSEDKDAPKQSPKKRQTSRRKKKTPPKKKRENVLDVSSISLEADEDSGFERIVDEDADTGELLKDAILQEAITNQVRAVEFDMESIESAEVGSLMDTLEESGFERIADDEEMEIAPKPKKRGRPRKKKTEDKKQTEESEESKPKRGRGRPRKNAVVEEESSEESSSEEEAPKKKRGRPRKKAPVEEKDQEKTENSGESETSEAKSEENEGDNEAIIDELEGKDASIDDDILGIAEMAVRRGSRGGRRRKNTSPGKKPAKTTTHMDKGYKASDGDKPITADNQIANAEFQKPAKRSRGKGRRRPKDKDLPKISDLLKEGQEILVQIAKEPIAKKGARITSHIALPGRFLVYMPTIEHLGVSRKIDSSKERSRLRKVLTKVTSDNDMPAGGFIVRTAGVGKSEDEIREDARYLAKSWTDIKGKAEKSKSKTLIHQDLDIILRLLRDHLSNDFTAIRVDSEDEYQRIVEFVNRIQPKLVKRVKFHTLDEPILDTYGVSDEINKALKHRVWLKSGGYLVINQTEALIAIDVNTGKFVGKGNARLEDTITKTNMEAVKEISRQIRLRDLGGIIVLDLIDMEDRSNRKKVLTALQDHLAKDKSPTKVLSFNDFGLIIMTRKRVKQSLERTLCAPCDNCDGAGWLKSPQTICYEILEEARRLSKNLGDVRYTTLRVHPVVAKALQTEEKEVFDHIEELIGVVDVTGDHGTHQEQFDFAFV